MNKIEGTIGVILAPARYVELLDAEEKLSKNAGPVTTQPLNSVEQDLNKVEAAPAPAVPPKMFEFEGKKYAFLADASVNVGSILHKFAGHPSLAPLVTAIPADVKAAIETRWLDVVAYKDIESGRIQVRMKEEFYATFKNLNPS